MAITTASPSTTSPLSSVTPRMESPAPSARPATVPCRHSAPSASAAPIRPVEGARLGDGRRLRRAEPPRERHLRRQPRVLASPACIDASLGVTSIRLDPSIAPGIAQRLGEIGVELEAAARQSVEIAAAAPVQRQEGARLAGGRSADLVAFDHHRPRAARRGVVGDGGADRAAAADRCAAPAHAWTGPGQAPALDRQARLSFTARGASAGSDGDQRHAAPIDARR